MGLDPAMIERVFADLNAYSEMIPLSKLKEWLESAEITLEDLRQFTRFDPDHYMRNLVNRGPRHQALLLCWRNGQRSPIHDHSGSNCAVKVLQGVATETLFDRAANGMIYAVESRELKVDGICVLRDDNIHQMSNLQADDTDLVTLHIYSPPLLSMNAYSLSDATISQFVDPINEDFVGGGGI